MTQAVVVRAADREQIEADWGGLTWYASDRLGNAGGMTVGICRLNPGCGNPLHHHPNCSEVLHVLRGKVSHVIEDGKTTELAEGDTITVPEGLVHNAMNVGDEEAVLLIAFSSGDRQVKGE